MAAAIDGGITAHVNQFNSHPINSGPMMQQARRRSLVKRTWPLMLPLVLAASLLLLRMPPIGDGPLDSSKASASADVIDDLQDPDKPVAATRLGGTTVLFIGINAPRNLSEAHAACRKAGGQLASVGAAQQGLLEQHLQAALLNLTHLELLQRAERHHGIAASASNLTTDTLLAGFCYNRQITGRRPVPQEAAARRVPLRPNVPVLWWMQDKDTKDATESSEGQNCQAWAVAEGGWMAELDCDTRLPFVCQVEEPGPAEYKHPDMPGLVALARHALPQAAITNRSFDPCCPSSSSTEKAGWRRWRSASALFKCNTAGRVSIMDLEPWHFTTTGSMLEDDYTTAGGSSWTARTLDQLQELSVRLDWLQAWESEDHWLDKFRACRPGSPLAQFQPATPICTQRLASLAPALQLLEIGRTSKELQTSIQDRESPSKWGFPYWPHSLRPASYSSIFWERPKPDQSFAHPLQSFPKGLKPLCGLRQLRVLRAFPVTAVPGMAAMYSRDWLQRATRSHASQPEVDKAAAAAAGAASVAGADLLPACLADLSELTVLELSHTTTTPMQLPAEWGRLRKLKALSIMHDVTCRDSLASESEAADQTAAPTITLPNSTTTTFYGCGLALPPSNKLTSTRTPCAKVQSLACVYAHWRHTCQCEGPMAAAISGTLPAEWGSLASLRDLSLPFHRLSGGLPASWAAGMVSLERLRLEGNALSGDLAPWFSSTKSGSSSSFPALRELLIGCNNISGPLPRRLDNLARLQLLKLDANSLSGDLSGAPLQLAPGLQMLSLQHNNLSGSLPCFQGPSSPAESGSHQLSLQAVNLADNRLSGTLPPCYKAGSGSTTPNLTLLDLSHQRADPAAVQAAFAAALQQAAAPPECKRMASTTACRDVQAAAAAAALSNLSIHVPIPASLLTIKQLVLAGLSLSGQLPEAAADAAIRAATSPSDRPWSPLALRDWHRNDRRMQLTASQQLSGGFDPVIPGSLLPGSCGSADLAGKGDRHSVYASFKLGHAGSLSVPLKDGSVEELRPPLQLGAFLPELSLSNRDSYSDDDYFWDQIEDPEFFVEYSDDTDADFQLHGLGAQSEPVPRAAINCAITPAGALVNEVVQVRRRQASSSYSGLRQETTDIAADHRALLTRIDAERAGLWWLWTLAAGDKGGPTSGPNERFPPPEALSSFLAAKCGTGICISIQALVRSTARSQGKQALNVIGAALAVVLTAGAACCVMAVRRSYPDGDFDAVGRWLQQQFQPRWLTTAGLLLMAAMSAVCCCGPFLGETGGQTTWLVAVLLTFAALCAVSVALTVWDAAADQVHQIRRQQLDDAGLALKQLQQAAADEPVSAALRQPLLGRLSCDDECCEGAAALLVAVNAAARLPWRAVAWLLAPFGVACLTLLLPVIVCSVLAHAWLPACLVLQLPANLLLRGGRLRLLRLLHITWAVVVSPVLAVVAATSPHLIDGFVWRVAGGCCFRRTFYRTELGLQQGWTDHGLRAAIAALQTPAVILLILSGLHMCVAVWELAGCMAAAAAMRMCVCCERAQQCDGTSRLVQWLRACVAGVVVLVLLLTLQAVMLRMMPDRQLPPFELRSMVLCCCAICVLCWLAVQHFMAAILQGSSSRSYSCIQSTAAKQSSRGGRWLAALAVDGLPHIVLQEERSGAAIAAANAEAFSAAAVCKIVALAAAVGFVCFCAACHLKWPASYHKYYLDDTCSF